jgi:hypothetical protein
MPVRLSALRAGLRLPPRNLPCTHFCKRLSRPQGHSAAGRIRSIEKNPPHSDSNPRSSGLWHSASTNYATASMYVNFGGTCCPCILQVGDGGGNVTPRRPIITSFTRSVRKRGTNKGVPHFLAHECVPSFTLRKK